MTSLTLATYNVNGIRARLPILLQWLEREQPDIVCLQELKAKCADFPRRNWKLRGMVRCGMVSLPGMGSPSWRATTSHWRFAGACREWPTTRNAATWRRR